MWFLFLVWVVLGSPFQESQNNGFFGSFVFFGFGCLVWAFWHPDFGVLTFFGFWKPVNIDLARGGGGGGASM